MKQTVYLFKTKKVFPNGKIKNLYKTGFIANREYERQLAKYGEDYIVEKNFFKDTGEVLMSIKRLNALIELSLTDKQANNLEKKYLDTIYQTFLKQEEKRLNPDFFIKLRDVIRSINDSRQNLQDIAECNDFNFFLTLTFDKDSIGGENARLNDKVTMSYYQKWANAIKHKFPNCFYITVPEYHKKGGLHFHILMGGITMEELELSNSGKVVCHWKKKGVTSKEIYDEEKQNHILAQTDGLIIYNIGAWKTGSGKNAKTLGYSTATEIVNKDATTYYVTKYLTKGGIDLRFYNRKRYFTSHNIIKPIIEKQNIEIGEVDITLTAEEKQEQIKKLVAEYNLHEKENLDLNSLVYRCEDKGYYIFEEN